MPNRARKRAATENIVYDPESAASQQKHVHAPKRRIVSPPPLQAGRRRKQVTLTQIERGIPRTGATIGDSEDEFDKSKPRKRSKTRKSRLPGKTESQNTLTQIGWLSTIPPSDSEEDEAECGVRNQDNDEGLSEIPPSDEELDESLDEEDVGVLIPDEEFNGFSDGDDIVPGGDEETEYETKQKSNQEDNDVDMSGDQTGGPRARLPSNPAIARQHQSPLGVNQEIPQTPQRIRRLEIPSSQTPPVTPLSAIHTHERKSLMRSPLQPLSANPRSPSDTPSRIRKTGSAMKSPKDQSTRKRVTIREPSSSSAPTSTSRSRVDIPDSDEEEDEDEDEEGDDDVAEAVAGIDIGQETQAYIRRIDFNCGCTRGTVEPDAGEGADDQDDDSGLPESSADRSFNFDEEAVGGSGDRSESLFSRAHSHPEGPPGHDETPTEIKKEPQTQQPWSVTQRPDAPLSTQHAVPTNEYLPGPLPPSQVSTTDGTTQNTPRSQIPPSPIHETYSTYFSDERIPASQPTQLHLKQILLRSSPHQSPRPSQASTADATTQHTQLDTHQRIPDSAPPSSPVCQRAPTSPLRSSPVAREVSGSRGRRNLEFNGARLITATQLLPEGMGDYSLPPPPPWTQDTEDEEE